MSFTKTRPGSVSRRVSPGRRNVFESQPKQNSVTVAKNSDQTNSKKDSLTPRVPRIRDIFDFHGSSDEDGDSVPDTQPVSPQDILKGVIAYIEVRSNTENRSEGISKQMEMLGAQISKKFTSDVTHVVFKDGKKSTKEKAIKKGAHLVSVLWIDSCKHNGKRVSEELFPVSSGSEGSPLIIGRLKRTKSMQPKSFEEDVKHSSEKVEKRKRRLEKLKARTPQASISFGEAQDARTCSPFVVRPSLTPKFVPRTPADFLGTSIHTDPTESCQKFKQACHDSSGESDIEKLAKKLQFESVTNEITASSTSLTNNNRKCGSDEPPPFQNDKSKQKRKLLSLKENSAPITILPDPLKLQSSDKLKKTTVVHFNKENISPHLKRKKSHSADEVNGKEQTNSKRRKCHENGSTKTSVSSAFLKSGRTGQLNKNKSSQVRTSLEDFREGETTVEGDSSKRKTKVEKGLGTYSDREKPKRKRKRRKKPRCLVMTSMHYSDQDIVVSVVEKLGRFSVQDNVCPLTSHVIAGNGRRTLNVLKAIYRGCWLLSPEWVMKSLEAGHWIEEEPYELSDDFPSAQLCRLERATVGDCYRSGLLAEVGVIYVGDGTSPSSEEIVNLILMSGGRVSMSKRGRKMLRYVIHTEMRQFALVRCLRKSKLFMCPRNGCWISWSTPTSDHVFQNHPQDSITSHNVLPFENYRTEPSSRTARPPSPTF